MLEVILQNPRGQAGLSVPSCPLHGTHDFSTANDFCCGKSGNLGREHQIDFQLRAGL